MCIFSGMPEHNSDYTPTGRLSDFDYDLPPAAIATRPAQPRESAKLLVVRPDALEDHVAADLPSLLRPGDLLVFNDTRVIPARLYGERVRDAASAKVEFLLHKELAPDSWQAYARPAKRLAIGDIVTLGEGFTATVTGKDADDGTVSLRFDRGGPALLEALAQHGHMPLPPYIDRADDAADQADYQTMFAAQPGAVAAPTASLHYTPALLSRLEAAGIGHVTITLHVGAGTFLPVRVEDVAHHRMHAERYHVSAEAAAAINAARKNDGRIIPVGTTALRTLESVADDHGVMHAGSGETRLFITPGYRFKAADLLLTNFHLPQSTLLMLVSAFSGRERMRDAYQHALNSGYRFFSYGDTSLLYPAATSGNV